MTSKDLCEKCRCKADHMNRNSSDIYVKGIFDMITRLEADLDMLKSKLRDRSLKF